MSQGTLINLNFLDSLNQELRIPTCSFIEVYSQKIRKQFKSNCCKENETIMNINSYP